jgi:MFS family permease
MVVMLFAQSNALAITFAVLFGLGQSMKGTLITLVTARSFGPKAFGQMLGIANSISAFMSMIAGIVIAALYDSAGSYTPAIIVIIAALVIGYIATMASFKSYDKLAEKVAAEKVAA